MERHVSIGLCIWSPACLRCRCLPFCPQEVRGPRRVRLCAGGRQVRRRRGQEERLHELQDQEVLHRRHEEGQCSRELLFQTEREREGERVGEKLLADQGILINN